MSVFMVCLFQNPPVNSLSNLVIDVDLARWLADIPATCPNPKREVNKVFAVGQQVRHPELAELGDADNGDCIVEFTNGTHAVMHFSRTARNGAEAFIEVYGTEQRVAVNPVRIHYCPAAVH